MITGFNTDIRHGERVFHVQTEDRGLANPVVESLVYVGGEILLSKKSPYAEYVEGGRVDEKAVRQLMDLQHRKIIEAIRRGRFDGRTASAHPQPPAPGSPTAEAVEVHAPGAPAEAAQSTVPLPPHVSPAAAAAAAAILAGSPLQPLRRPPPAAGPHPSGPLPSRPRPVPPGPVPPPPPSPPRAPAPGEGERSPAFDPSPEGRNRGGRVPSGIGVAPERTLDQVIVDYLASEAASEHLELHVSRSGEVLAGETVMLDVKAATSLTARPLAGVHVTIRVVSTSAAPQILFRGTTGPSGVLHATCTIPDFGAANAALIVSASSAIGNHEVKQLVRRRTR